MLRTSKRTFVVPLDSQSIHFDRINWLMRKFDSIQMTLRFGCECATLVKNQSFLFCLSNFIRFDLILVLSFFVEVEKKKFEEKYYTLHAICHNFSCDITSFRNKNLPMYRWKFIFSVLHCFRACAIPCAIKRTVNSIWKMWKSFFFLLPQDHSWFDEI